MASIDQFKAQLIGGGPRSNRFRVFIPRTGNRIEFLCSAAQIPAADIGEVKVKWMGNELKMPGDRTFADWTVTIINDIEFSARTALELWQGEIVGYGDSQGSTSLDFMVDRAYVEQLDKSDAVLARYEFFNMWPKTIAAISLSYETGADAVQTFEATFAFSHWERVL
jgi:hypothetical protein